MTQPRTQTVLTAGMLAALLMSTASCSEPWATGLSEADAAQVAETFEAYRNAVAADDGAVAADWVTAATLRHAAELRDLALDATLAELEAGPIGTEMHVLMFRLHAQPEALEAMDARGAFAFGVEKGLISNLWKSRHELRDLRVEAGGGAVVASRYARDYEVGAPLRFVREAGRWKLDLMPEFERLSALMEADAREIGVDLRDLARARIEIYSLKTLAPRHLEPYRARRAG